MSLERFLEGVVRALEQHGFSYMLTGSLAAAWYAAPRATQDVDLVFAGDPGRIAPLVVHLTDRGYYVSLEAAEEAVRSHRQFNVIDPETGWKADLIVRKNRAFSRAEFDRRRSARVLGLEMPLASPEDLILAKLEWAALGGSERQIQDAAELIRSLGDDLERTYIEGWLEDLGVLSEWRDALARAEGRD